MAAKYHVQARHVHLKDDLVTWVNVFIALRNDATREARRRVGLGLVGAIFALLLLAVEGFVRIVLVRAVVAFSYVIFICNT
jgi:hypothetical protein